MEKSVIGDEAGIDRYLVLEFFTVFSRFEYALKREGFLTTANGDANPNWDGFFDRYKDISLRLCTASSDAKHILSNPPMKQIVRNNVLGWTSANSEDELEYQRLNLFIRRIRNNLFHGGKFPFAPVAEPARNEKLIRAALNVLNEIRCEIEQINQHFDLKSV